MECRNYRRTSHVNSAHKVLSITLREFYHMQEKLSEVISLNFERTELMQSKFSSIATENEKSYRVSSDTASSICGLSLQLHMTE
jgi:hypothetical protein